MNREQTIDRWLERFPIFTTLAPQHLQLARGTVQFPTLEPGDVAYREEQDCPNYVMCIDGLTRVFKISPAGREILIYKVAGGGTCVLTTQCLLSSGNFPAESIAEQRTELAALPRETFQHLMKESERFKNFVIEDYSRLLTQLITLIDEVAFCSTPHRLSRRLLAEADPQGIIQKTHAQLASDIGTVREVVSRHIGEWEKSGVIKSGRSEITILDRAALAAMR